MVTSSPQNFTITSMKLSLSFATEIIDFLDHLNSGVIQTGIGLVLNLTVDPSINKSCAYFFRFCYFDSFYA
jgi:hypothetical protein